MPVQFFVWDSSPAGARGEPESEPVTPLPKAKAKAKAKAKGKARTPVSVPAAAAELAAETGGPTAQDRVVDQVFVGGRPSHPRRAERTITSLPQLPGHISLLVVRR